MFIVSEKIMENINKIRTCIGTGSVYDCVPIFIQFEKDDLKPPAPFKFNSNWLGDEDFIKIVKEERIKYDAQAEGSAMHQFFLNLKRVKRILWNGLGRNIIFLKKTSKR
jgi:hypothetical protein